MTPKTAISEARRLHERLVGEQLDEQLSGDQRAQLAREISRLLFEAERAGALPNSCRLLFLRLRTDAEHIAGLHEAEGIRSRPEVWEHYDELLRSCVK